MPKVDYPGAIGLFVDEQRVFIDNNKRKWLCLHKTASGGRAQDIAHFFATDPNMASTHYVVGQDGTVVQCVLEKDGAAGNCCLNGNYAPFLPTGTNLNWWTISIEHVDPDSQNRTPLTDAQKAASFKLIKDICARNNIPMRRGDKNGGIIGHCDIDTINRAHCPGNYPFDELWTYLQGEEEVTIDINTPGINGWYTQNADGSWTCKKNGKTIHGDILKTYCSYGGNGLCGLTWLGLPISNEQNTGTKAKRQFYERGCLVFDPDHELDNPPGSGSVYAAHVYREDTSKPVTGEDPLLATQQATIAQLQQQLAQAQQTSTPQALPVLQQIKQLVAPF